MPAKQNHPHILSHTHTHPPTHTHTFNLNREQPEGLGNDANIHAATPHEFEIVLHYAMAWLLLHLVTSLAATVLSDCVRG